MTKECTYTVLADEENFRLDKFLLKKHTQSHVEDCFKSHIGDCSQSHSKSHVEDCSKSHIRDCSKEQTKHGLRYFRRLCDENTVLVNDRIKPAHYKVQAGDLILLHSPKIGNEEKLLLVEPHRLEIVKNENYTSFYKPENMHSAVIRGKNTHAFERDIAHLLPNFPDAELLNRLDFLTSGILLLSLNKEAKEKFLVYEKNGEIEKKYFAIVKGHVKEAFTIKNALDTDNRKKTKVLNTIADPKRWTHITPLTSIAYYNHNEHNECDNCANGETVNGKSEYDKNKYNCGGVSLVLATIKCGARHQIRAHLASAGFPIMYDPLYEPHNADMNETNDETNSKVPTERLFLHHAYIAFADFTAINLPTWEHAQFSPAHFDYEQYL